MLWQGIFMSTFHYVVKKRRWESPQGFHNSVGGLENKYRFTIDNIIML